MTGYSDRFWTSSDGLRLYARDYAGGDGEAKLPVVCIHGLTRNSKDFEDVAPPIAAAGRRVLVLDVRGRGRSDRGESAGYQVPTYAADVIALMDALGIARAAFIGTSMGGLITMTLAALAPARVAAALLNDVGPELGAAGIARIASYVGKPAKIDTWEDAAAYARATNGAAFPDRPGSFWDAFARRILREDEQGRPALDYDPAIASAVAPGALPDLWPLFAAFAAGRPIALVRGGISDLITADIAARMKAAAPHLDVTEVPGIGHAPMLDEPEAAGAIRRFLGEAP